jgi:Cof subfamily protein (haloacid dehalogenase superfamily)
VVTARLPGLVATDLDGTLLRSDGTVSDRTVAALRLVEKAGVPLVLVTGRPVRWMQPVAREVGHTGFAVCGNGAVLYDLQEERIVETFPLAAEAAAAVVAAVAVALPGVGFAVESADRGYLHDRTYAEDALPGARVVEVDDLVGEPVLKLLVRHPSMDPDELLAAAREVAGGLAELTHSSSEGLLEVSAAGVTKAATLATVAEQFGVRAADVLAFGDMPNDLPMLAWAGTAYAMANAHPDVLAAVDLVAPHHDDDGVAQVLEDRFAAG